MKKELYPGTTATVNGREVLFVRKAHNRRFDHRILVESQEISRRRNQEYNEEHA